jgi:hypothetical protein
VSLRVNISKEVALAALRAAAWPERHDPVYEPAKYSDGVAVLLAGEQLYRDVTPPTQMIVHTFGGPFGADWNLEHAEEFISAASGVFWGFSLFGHHLHAVSDGPDGRCISFDVEAPAEVRAEWQRQAVKP